MIITKNNINLIPENERGLVQALLQDLEEINNNLSSDHSNLKIEWIDKHTEWSPERVDPCPDFYGSYRIREGEEILGVEMDLNTLDSSLCLLHNFIIKQI